MAANVDESAPKPLDDESVARILEALFHDQSTRAYAILDGASVPGLLPQLVESKPVHECLFRGEQPADVLEMAPYLVQLEKDSAFTLWVLREGWGQHWGVFAVTPADLRTISRQLRMMMQVRNDTGKIVFFRFYDPRVLRAYLPTCDAREIAAVFGPVRWYGAESKDAAVLMRFHVSPDKPRVDRVAVKSMTGADV